jgi:hypothetical protein
MSFCGPENTFLNLSSRVLLLICNSGFHQRIEMREKIITMLARIEDPLLREKLKKELERGGKIKPEPPPAPIRLYVTGYRVLATCILKKGSPQITCHRGEQIFYDGGHYYVKRHPNMPLHNYLVRTALKRGYLKEF